MVSRCFRISLVDSNHDTENLRYIIKPWVDISKDNYKSKNLSPRFHELRDEIDAPPASTKNDKQDKFQ